MKKRGNSYFRQKQYGRALREYNEAIKLCPADHTLWSNRSAAYIEIGDYAAALRDGQKCIELAPEWVKGYYRAGMALFKMERVEEAERVYEQGIVFESESISIRQNDSL